MPSRHLYNAYKIFCAAITISMLSSNSVLRTEATQKLSVSSSSFADGAPLLKKYTGDGADVSPPLTWTAGPKGSKSYALCCSDPDAVPEPFWHWTLFNISPNTKQLGENVPKVVCLAQGVTQGANDARTAGYTGPAPPPGKVHHYVFQLMALDTMLSLKPGCDKNSFKTAIKGHILAEGQITGTYKR
jgi:hypothetical protein